MKNLLVLNNFSIYPPNHGGKIRIYNIYMELSAKYNVRCICFGDSKEIERNQLAENFIEVKIPKSYIHKWMEKFFGSLLGLSIDDIIAMFFCKLNRKLFQTVDNFLADSDIVISSHPYMYPILKRNAKKKLLVYEAHNAEYFLKKSMIGNGLFRQFLYNYVKKIEGELVTASDLIFIPSNEGIRSFKYLYNAADSKIFISPNGVNISAFNILYKNNKLLKYRVIKQPLAIFMGSGHPPNAEAAKNIIYEIAPRMKDVFFLLCGAVCWSVKNEKIGRNVGLTFEVTDDEKMELYRVSDIALNPMMSGSGTNIKMLDYMAAGLPTVTTLTGARGLDIENYHEVIICAVQNFPEKIREVLNNGELYHELSHNGYRIVKEKYDWKKIAEDMINILEEKLNAIIEV